MANADAPGVSLEQARALVAAGYRALEARRQEVNDLNVYPVPDGDTGTNLSLTVKHVLDDLMAAPVDLTTAEVCGLVATGALMGARGNSGVILSQIVRGAVEPFAEGGPVTPARIGSSLERASERAYAAVRRPVEGTMLTVIRELAEAAADSTESDLEEFLSAVLEAGWESVRRTPTLLKVLADAGVVDAGGYGLMVLVEGMVHGTVAGAAVPVRYHDELARLPDRDLVVEEAVSPYTYCTSFLLTGVDLDPQALEQSLLQLGDSLLVVGDERQIKVHVHTDEPGTVLGLGTAKGTLHEIEISNMKVQTAARDEHLRALTSPTGSGHEGGEAQARTQVVTVVAGAGIKGLFRSLGATLFVDGGQSMNPSAQELLAAVDRASAPTVVLLPNNRNIILTAEQVAHLAEREVVVVPTRSLQAGLSAMVAYDADLDAGENLAAMSEAMAQVVTGSVTSAVRDSVVDGLSVREGDLIGLVDDHVVTTGDDMESVAEAVLERLIDDRREIVTLITGDGSAPADIDRLAERLRARYPEIEFEVHEGGQPVYPLLLAAE